MRYTHVVTVIAWAFLALWTSVATAQEAPTLTMVTESHIKPGMLSQFEEARKESLAFRAEHDFAFTELASLSDGGVFRTITFLGEGWEDLNKRTEWFQQFDSPPAFVSNLNEARDHMDSSIHRPRPELGNNPENPRVPVEEWGIIREIRFYLRPGTVREADEILGEIRDVNTRHNIRERRIVSSQVTGSDGPHISVFLPARDLVDWYTQSPKITEMMGDEIQMLRQKLRGLSRKTQWVNWTLRRDLTYQATN